MLYTLMLERKSPPISQKGVVDAARKQAQRPHSKCTFKDPKVKIEHANLSSIQALPLTIELLVLLQEDKREDGVRAHADEAGDPALEHPSQALGTCDFGEKGEDALLRRGAHHARLDDVYRGADGCGDEACEEGGREVGCQVVLERRVVEKGALEPVVCSDLANGHEDGSG